MIRRQLKRSEVEGNPHLVWNAFVDLIAVEDYSDLTEIQRLAHLIFWYEAEVQNGGHLQYFANSAGERPEETLTALQSLKMEDQFKILERAISVLRKHPLQDLETAEDYVAEALDDNFGDLDRRYYECAKPTNDYLEEYLEANFSEFIELH